MDRVCDIRDLDYEDNTVDEVLMLHSIEHLRLDDACRVIRKIFAMLKPGGHILIEAPDVFKAVKNCPNGEFEVITGIFGSLKETRKGQDGYLHRWGWTGSLMQQELSSAGFDVLPVTDGVVHGRPWRDFRVIGYKPEKANGNGNLS